MFSDLSFQFRTTLPCVGLGFWCHCFFLHLVLLLLVHFFLSLLLKLFLLCVVLWLLLLGGGRGR